MWKRSAILRTAGRLFNQKGFRETSLNDLADELQVTKPTLYYYVENKGRHPVSVPPHRHHGSAGPDRHHSAGAPERD
ncbi:MAG: helix-turn-helix transcriptional regulator [Gammaproteobacteria bacterium]|nr:helix-turn-helix transcriptional regulator [Gammaproteobacteria bacterium]